MSASAGEELVDVVDEHDVVIGTVTRAEMRAGRLRHRAVSIAVIGSDGRLLIHRRAHTKDIWPGWWDIAAGGVVGAGESYDQAARRELAEELGVHADRLEPLGTAAYEDALSRCSTDYAPWFVIPAEKKWFRNFAVSQIVVETLEGLGMKFPPAPPEIAKLGRRAR